MEKTTMIKLMSTAILGFISAVVGGFDSLFIFYITLIIFDYILGAFKAIKTKTFASSLMFWGFINKILSICFVAIGFALDNLLNLCILRNMFIIWFTLCESASILENTVVLGLNLPQGLTEILLQVKQGFSINFLNVVKKIIEDNSKKGE